LKEPYLKPNFKGYIELASSTLISPFFKKKMFVVLGDGET